MFLYVYEQIVQVTVYKNQKGLKIYLAGDI